MKKTIYAGLVLAASVMVSTAHAKAMLMSVSPSNASGPILSYNIVTPEGKDLPLDEVRILAGFSTSSPCSDLHVVGDYHAEGDDSMFVENGTDTVTSEDLSELIGAKATCIKWDAIAKGKTYSSGNVKLDWNDLTNEYVKANPASFSMDFTG